jgi:uncharacterized membrane protein
VSLVDYNDSPNFENVDNEISVASPQGPEVYSPDAVAITKPEKQYASYNSQVEEVIEDEPIENKNIKIGRYVMYGGLLIYLFTVVKSIAWLNFIGFMLFLLGLIFYLIARKKMVKEQPDYQRSDKSKYLMKSGTITLVVGVILALLSALIISAAETATGTTATAVGGTLGVIFGSLLGACAFIMIVIGIIRLIHGLSKI